MSLAFNKQLPSPSLAPFVSFFYTIESPSSAQNPFFLQNHPQGSMDIVVVIRGAVTMSYEHGKNPQPMSPGSIFIVAQQESGFHVNFSPDSKVVGVVFVAESFTKLFNFPIHEITNNGINATEDLDDDYRTLVHQLQDNMVSNVRIFQLLDLFFHKKLASQNVEIDNLDKLIQHVRQTGGNFSIDELARHANVSARTLQRTMKERLGLSPKSYSKIVRFNYALLLMTNHPDYDWHDVLYRCGYYDQMHFIKDFKQFTGQTPTAFISSNTEFSGFFRGS